MKNPFWWEEVQLALIVKWPVSFVHSFLHMMPIRGADYCCAYVLSPFWEIFHQALMVVLIINERIFEILTITIQTRKKTSLVWTFATRHYLWLLLVFDSMSKLWVLNLSKPFLVWKIVFHCFSFIRCSHPNIRWIIAKLSHWWQLTLSTKLEIICAC